MVYIYKKIISGKSYYYLRASIKKRDRIITKDIAYLGSSPEEVKKRLQKLPKKYGQSIRKAYYSITSILERNSYILEAKKLRLKKDDFIEQNLLESVEACRLHYQEFLKKHPQEKMDTYKNFAIEFSFNTTSIEGNTITLKEAERLLNENLSPKNKTLREVFDVQNTNSVFFDILNKKSELNNETIQNIHAELMKNMDTRTGYRNYDVRVFKSHFDASPAIYVKADMKLLLNFYSKYKKKLHPLSLAVIFHHKFEKIHPFADGNGRTGRMIINLILIESGYPPLIIAKSQRGKYLDMLARCDKIDLEKVGTEYDGLIEYIAKSLIKSYWNIFL